MNFQSFHGTLRCRWWNFADGHQGNNTLTWDNTPPQAGRLRLLLVEDEPLLSMLLQEMVEDLGHVVSQTCPDLTSALRAVDAGAFDAAFLDLNLCGETAEPIAERLREVGIPFVIATGDARAAGAIEALAVVSKPYRFQDIERALDILSLHA